VKDLSF